MKSFLEGNHKVQVVDVPMPVLEPGMVLAKVLASAMCGSERDIWVRELKGDETFLNFGHEAVCEIVDPNGSTRLSKGDRVAVQIHNYCGECYYCKKELPIFCMDRHQKPVMCHAEYVMLPEPCFFKIDADIPADVAVLLGGDLMGVAYRALKRLPLQKDDVLLVSGGGPVGLGVAFMANYLGAHVVLSEPSANRREYGMKYAGVREAFDPLTEDVQAELLKLTDGLGPRFSIECSGVPSAQKNVLEWTRCEGWVVFCGQNYGTLEIRPSHWLIHKELIVTGAKYYVPNDVTEIVKMYRNGMDPSALISDRVTFDNYEEAVDAFFKATSSGKVILLPNG